MQNPVWQGNEVNKYGVMREVTEHELFRGENDIQDCLILGKEVLQNSHDERTDEAKAKGEPARVVFTFGSTSAKQGTWCLNGLEDRLIACDMDLPDEFLSPTIPYLLIEDFNTNGLIGNINPTVKADKVKGNNFATFWHWIGKTNKGGGKLGSKGLGKAALYGASQIHTIIGLTIQETNDPHFKAAAMVMGRSELKNHTLGKVEYDPFVWFADKRENGWWPLMSPGFPTIGNQFRQTFNSQRITEPGFSIVILFPHKGITASVLEFAAVHYWYAIQNGLLEVVINDNGNQRVINKENIRGLLDSNDQYKDFAILSDLVAAKQTPHLIFNPTSKLEWKSMSMPDNIDAVRELAQQGKSVHIRISVPIKLKGKPTETGYLDIILQRDADGRRSKPHILREGLHISQAVRETEPYRMVAPIESGPLADLLREGENASHDNWNQTEPKLKKLYEKGAEVIAFVKEAIHEAVSSLSPRVGELNHHALIDFFSLKIEKVNEEKIKQEIGMPQGVKSRKNLCEVWPLLSTGGLTIAETKEAHVPRRLKIRLKYAGATKHNPNDFDLEQMNKDGLIDWNKKCHVKVTAPDTLLVTDIEEGFKVTIEEGFDHNRNLVFRATRR